MVTDWDGATGAPTPGRSSEAPEPAATPRHPDHADPGADGSPPAGRAVHLIDAGEMLDRLDAEAVAQKLRDRSFFWLDLRSPDEADFQTLAELFGFHHLALEDSRAFGERPKLDDYGDYAFLVVYGVNAHPEDLVELAEVHCFISPHYLVTVHRAYCPGFEEVRRWLLDRRDLQHPGGALTYRVADSLVDSFFPVLADFDDRLDALEDDIFVDPDDAQLQDVLRMKRALVALRKVVTPQRDLCARLVNGALTIPAPATLDEPARREAERYYRDLYDHLIRIADLVDTYRDLMTGTMDVYLSTVQNRMDSVMKKLTVIATIFLPLTWLTGFFGMNFGAMVKAVGDWQAFVILGVGLQVAAVVILLWLMRSRRWL
jgi:magnesium transporter